MHPLPPPLTKDCAGVGENCIFSSSISSFGYGYEAVRIGVKTVLCSGVIIINKGDLYIGG
jgi:hypothetical protein